MIAHSGWGTAGILHPSSDRGSAQDYLLAIAIDNGIVFHLEDSGGHDCKTL